MRGEVSRSHCDQLFDPATMEVGCFNCVSCRFVVLLVEERSRCEMTGTPQLHDKCMIQFSPLALKLSQALHIAFT